MFEWTAIFGDSEGKKRRGSFNNVDLTPQQQAILAHYLQSRPPEYLVPRRMRKKASYTHAYSINSQHSQQRRPSLASLSPRAPRSPRTPPRSPRSPAPAQYDNVSQPRRRKSLFDVQPALKNLPRCNSINMNASGRVVKPLQEIRRRSLVAKVSATMKFMIGNCLRSVTPPHVAVLVAETL